MVEGCVLIILSHAHVQTPVYYGGRIRIASQFAFSGRKVNVQTSVNKTKNKIKILNDGDILSLYLPQLKPD